MQSAYPYEAIRWVVRMNFGKRLLAIASSWRHGVPKTHGTRRLFLKLSECGLQPPICVRTPKSGMVRVGRRASRGVSRKHRVAIAVGLGMMAMLAFWSADDRSHDFVTGAGEIRVVILPDGSRATLNARAAIDLKFSANDRQITLALGEAFFEVSPDAKRPFQVKAADAVDSSRDIVQCEDAFCSERAGSCCRRACSQSGASAAEQQLKIRPCAGKLSGRDSFRNNRAH